VMTSTSIRVLVVDDHRLVRDGLALIIDREPDMTVVGFASTAQEALAQFGALAPDITLMDLRLDDSSGLDAIRGIRQHVSDARIIVLTMYEGDEDIYRALTAGASAYLLKDALSNDLIRVVRAVHAGERPLSPRIQARLDERADREALTPREVQVLQLVSRGLRNKQIAAELNISEETVPVHMRNIFIKLNVRERTSAVHVAVRRGIVHLA
jgi:two-component system NarL family response regulator